jgi:hypothetical protein
MKYEIHQIVLPEWMCHDVNRNGHAAVAGTYPIYKTYLDAIMGRWTQGTLIHYTHVATIDADSLDDVFRVGNIGPEEQIERHGRMHSVSVGDVVGDESGVLHFCAPIGWEVVQDYRSAA